MCMADFRILQSVSMLEQACYERSLYSLLQYWCHCPDEMETSMCPAQLQA